MAEAAFEIFAPLAQQGPAALASRGAHGSVKGLAVFLGDVTAALSGVGGGDDGAQGLALQLGDLFCGEATFVCDDADAEFLPFSKSPLRLPTRCPPRLALAGPCWSLCHRRL